MSDEHKVDCQRDVQTYITDALNRYDLEVKMSYYLTSIYGKRARLFFAILFLFASRNLQPRHDVCDSPAMLLLLCIIHSAPFASVFVVFHRLATSI